MRMLQIYNKVQTLDLQNEKYSIFVILRLLNKIQ